MAVSCYKSPFQCPEIVDQPGLDVFGQVYNQWKNKECVCPNCSRSIAASRFAPHLEKCLGMGRNSSRIANRRYGSKAANNLPVRDPCQHVSSAPFDNCVSVLMCISIHELVTICENEESILSSNCIYFVIQPFSCAVSNTESPCVSCLPSFTE